MGLDALTAAPRTVAIGGRHYLISPPSLRGYGLLAAYLRDALGPGPHPLNADRSIDALFAGGIPHMLYVSLRRDWPTLTFDHACRLAAKAADDQAALSRLARVIFGLADAPKEGRGDADPGDGEPADPHASDVLTLNWGRLFEGERLAGRFTYADLADMTLEQFNNIATGGESEDDRSLTMDEVMAMYDAANEGEAADGGE